MIEEAKLDDLFNLIASETGQELHKLMQIISLIKPNNGIDEKKLIKLMEEADAVRAFRQMHERDFFGIKKNDVETFRRSGIGEGGCDFKHCCINFIHSIEIAQKELRLFANAKNEIEKKIHMEKALNYLRAARIYKEMAFQMRELFEVKK